MAAKKSEKIYRQQFWHVRLIYFYDTGFLGNEATGQLVNIGAKKYFFRVARFYQKKFRLGFCSNVADSALAFVNKTMAF